MLFFGNDYEDTLAFFRGDRDISEALTKLRSTSKIVEWEKKKRAKRIKNVLQCPMC